MVKRKYIAVAVLLFCCASLAQGQCTGYTITGTSVNVLSPTDAAKQGYVTATLTIKANLTDGNGNQLGALSHNATFTPGVQVTLTATSNNATSLVLKSYANGGTTPYSTQSITPNAKNQWTWTTSQANVGNSYQYVLVAANGATSQDRLSFSVVAGSSTSIVSQDGVHTNAYYQLVSTFGGGSMMNSCSQCQGGSTQHCLQATHTPLFDANLTNPQSGETQTISNASAGNVATATESVSGIASIAISVLPGDRPTGSTTDKIYCSMLSWVMSQQWNPGLPENEFAITELETISSTCQLALRFFETGDSWGVQCQVAWKKPPATADRCSAISQIPDFNPATVWDEQDCKVPGNCNTSDLPPPNGTNTSFPKYWYGGSWGIRFGGPPAPGQPDPIINGGAHNWVFPIYLADAYIPGGPDEQWWILDLLNIAVAKGTGLPIDCTNRDKGTSPIQSPW